MQDLLVGLVAFLVGLFAGLVVWLRTKGRQEAQISELRARAATLEAEKKAEQQKLEWVGSAQDALRDTFSVLAGDALKSNAQALTAEAKKDIDGVVSPMREKLASLDQHIRELERVRAGAYQSISTELVQLREAHGKLQQSTITLSQALRSPTVRGRWGEIELRRIVEMAGMEGHVAFEEQAATEAGRPDMIVHLTNRGILPVDSKVPLDSYLSAMESSEEDQRNLHLAAHARAVRGRINELGQKRYWDQFPSSPDFVVMFVPNESCLGAAFGKDPRLLEDAIEKKVLICSPVTLLALLRTVAFGWQQHRITENAMAIAEEGKELFRRVQKFAEHFGFVGTALGKSVAAYNSAVASFDSRLVPALTRLQDMGASEKAFEAPEDVTVIPSEPRLFSITAGQD